MSEPKVKTKRAHGSRRFQLGTTVRYVLLFISLALVLIPVYVLIVTSLRARLRLTPPPPGTCLNTGKLKTGRGLGKN